MLAAYRELIGFIILQAIEDLQEALEDGRIAAHGRSYRLTNKAFSRHGTGARADELGHAIELIFGNDIEGLMRDAGMNIPIRDIRNAISRKKNRAPHRADNTVREET